MDYIFFDFNGTIIDDVDLCLDLLNEMLTMKNHKKISKEKYLDIFTFPVIEYYKKAGFVFPDDNFVELANYFIKRYQKESKKCSMFADVKCVLEELKQSNKHLYILSASEKTMLLSQLKHYNIDCYFEQILGKDNIYAEGKTEVGIKFMKEQQLPKDKCVFIGDTIHDDETARKMGIKCYLVSRGHQSEKILNSSNSKVFNSLKDIKF